MQIRSGLAKVLSSNHRRIQFSGMTPEDAALLAPSQAFKYQGSTEFMLFFTIASVISVSAPEVEITADYNGTVPFDTFASYIIWSGFTPIHGLMEFDPSDIDIRNGMTYNVRLEDTLLGTGGGGSGLTASGVASVTADAVTKTITGTFPTGAAYPVYVTPNWMTTVMVRPGSKTTTQFIVDLSVPAPSGAELNWGVA